MARPHPADQWKYRKPPQLNDGWPTATLADVAIGDRAYGYQWWVNEYPYNDTTGRTKGV